MTNNHKKRKENIYDFLLFIKAFLTINKYKKYVLVFIITNKKT